MFLRYLLYDTGLSSALATGLAACFATGLAAGSTAICGGFDDYQLRVGSVSKDVFGYAVRYHEGDARVLTELGEDSL